MWPRGVGGTPKTRITAGDHVSSIRTARSAILAVGPHLTSAVPQQRENGNRLAGPVGAVLQLQKAPISPGGMTFWRPARRSGPARPTNKAMALDAEQRISPQALESGGRSPRSEVSLVTPRWPRSSTAFMRRRGLGRRGCGPRIEPRWTGRAIRSVTPRQRIFKRIIFTLDRVRLIHHRSGGSPANIRLRGQLTALVVPSFASQFTGQGAELLDGRHDVVLGAWVLVDPRRYNGLIIDSSALPNAPRPGSSPPSVAPRTPMAEAPQRSSCGPWSRSPIRWISGVRRT